MSKAFTRFLKRFGWFCASLFLVMTLLQTSAPAQDTNLGFRITRLETENSSLRARISQLESQIYRVGNRLPGNQPNPQNNPTTLRSQDPMFDRLATLAVEQKERMDQLEARLAALEAR